MKRRLVVCLALAAGLAGHLWFSYRPRLRPTVPAPDSSAVVALLSAPATWGFWLPYPHQNLGVVARNVVDLDAVLAAASRLAGRPSPRSPRFGPFRVPPSREAGAAGDSRGTSATIELYPSTAVVVRLSGLLAGNPWLAGGAVEAGAANGTVEWSGRRWQLSAGEPRGIDPALAAVLPTTPVLALLRSGQPLGVLPPGFYALRQTGGGQELDRLDAPALPAESRPPIGADADALAALFVARRADGVAEAMALFTSGASGGLPALATFVHGEGRPSGIAATLPLDKLGRLLGGLPQATVAGWHIESIDADTLRRATALAVSLDAGGAGGMVASAWLRPVAAREALATLRQWLEGLGPLLPSRLVEGSRDLDVVLAALAPVDRIEAVVAADGGARLRLVD